MMMMMMQNAAVLLKMMAFEPLTLKKEAETIGGESYLTAKKTKNYENRPIKNNLRNQRSIEYNINTKLTL